MSGISSSSFCFSENASSSLAFALFTTSVNELVAVSPNWAVAKPRSSVDEVMASSVCTRARPARRVSSSSLMASRGSPVGVGVARLTRAAARRRITTKTMIAPITASTQRTMSRMPPMSDDPDPENPSAAVRTAPAQSFVRRSFTSDCEIWSTRDSGTGPALSADR